MMTAAAKAAAAWDGLNARQRAYLRCLYDLDQATEEFERGAFAAGGRARAAAEWRWIRYGYVNVGPGAPRGAMQRALDVRNRRDQGAGSTLAVLANRGLIEHRHDELDAAVLQATWCRDDTYHVSVQLTRAGRAAARASGVDDTRPARAPRGMLSEWLWSATSSCTARYSTADHGTSSGSARNVPIQRTVPSCNANPSRL